MAQPEVHQYDVGTVFLLTLQDQDGTAVDVSGTDVKQIHFRKSDGTTVITKDAAWGSGNNGTDGKIKYVVEDDTILDQAGTWTLQAFVHWATSDQWSSELYEFMVRENLA